MSKQEYDGLKNGDLVQLENGKIYELFIGGGTAYLSFVQIRDGRRYGPVRRLKAENVTKMIRTQGVKVM